MQVKIFCIPAIGDEDLNEEMNRFFRSKKVLQIESNLVQAIGGAYWSFCIRYVESVVATDTVPSMDYRKVLSEVEFARYTQLRAIRKQRAAEDNVPVFTIFTNEELAEMAKLEIITVAALRRIKGIGDKKIEKYASLFLTKTDDEKG